MLSADASVFVPGGWSASGDVDGATIDDMKSTTVSDSTPRESPLWVKDAAPTWRELEMQPYAPLLSDAGGVWQWEAGVADLEVCALPPSCDQELSGPPSNDVVLLGCHSGDAGVESNFREDGEVTRVHDWGYPHRRVDEFWNAEVPSNEPVPHWPEGRDGKQVDEFWSGEVPVDGPVPHWPEGTNNERVTEFWDAQVPSLEPVPHWPEGVSGMCEGMAVDVSSGAAPKVKEQEVVAGPVLEPPYASTDATARELAPRPLEAGDEPLAVGLNGKLDGHAWLVPAVGKVDAASDSHKVSLGQVSVKELYQLFLLKGAGA